jgi:hypothetical protein
MSSHTVPLTAVECPTPDQMKQFYVLVGEGKAHKDNFQEYLRGIYLGAAAPTAAQAQVPKDPKTENPALYWAEVAAQRHFPSTVNEILQVVAPYTNIKEVEFKPAATKKMTVRSDAGGAQLQRTVYDNRDGLERALFWKKVTEVKVHTLGHRQTYMPITDDAALRQNRMFRTVNEEMLKEEVATRVNLESNCLQTVSAVISRLDGQLINLFRKTGAYQYRLICEEAQIIAHSIYYALGKAVLFAAYRDSNRARQILQFVDWQLAGNPIVDYRDGVVHLLAGPGITL